jgi:ABC-2 type transport system ATP-binding protein
MNKYIDGLLKLFEIEDKKNIKVNFLSGGERKKITAIIALMNNPEILFFDEPSVSLDAGTRKTVWQILKKLVKEQKSLLLFTSHDMNEIE